MALASVAASVVLASSSLGANPSPSAAGVAVLGNGVVWIDEGRVLFQGFSPGSASLGTVEAEGGLASSASAFAFAPSWGTMNLFLGGTPSSRRLAPIEQISAPLSGGECGNWLAQVDGEFVVAGNELVDAASCGYESGAALEEHTTAREPLFVRSLSHGRWRVLAWLNSEGKPTLAAEGDLLAVGVPPPCDCLGGGSSSQKGMNVSILNLTTGRVVAHFRTPDGHLSFASARRLLLSTPVARGEQSEVKAAGDSSTRIAQIILRRPAKYRLMLYSLTGHRLEVLGTVSELRLQDSEGLGLVAGGRAGFSEGPPLVSHMRRLLEEYVDGENVLAVRNLLGGPPRRLIGLGAAQELLGIAFRWPAVAVEERLREPLTQREVTCTSGEYHKPGRPFLSVFDLNRAEPFIPAPPAAHLSPPPPSDHCRVARTSQSP